MTQGYAVGNINAGVNQLADGGRLTLTSGLPVTVSDVLAATSVYYTPYISGYISLWNATISGWITLPFTELTISVPSTTSTMYDVFLYNNSGAVASELVAWTNDTTRATAIVQQNGLYVKTGDATRRYVGSLRTTTVSGQTEDSVLKRYVWNYNNRVSRPMIVSAPTTSWNYTTATFRQANANAATQCDAVIGVIEDMIYLEVNTTFFGGVGIYATVGIGVNSTSVNTATNWTVNSCSSTSTSTTSAVYNAYPTTAGRSFYPWLEWSVASGTTTWFGTTNGGAVVTKSGMSGFLRG